jgi:hypothetical protein
MAATWPIKFTNDAKPGKALKCKREESVAKDYEEEETDRFYPLGKLEDHGFCLIRIKV